MPKRTDLETILIIGSGPDRHRAGVRVRLLGHAGVPRAARRGLPRRARELEPGDDHDRPRVRRRHLRRAARRRRASPASSNASGPTRCSRRSAARPRSTSRSSCTRPGVLEQYGVELIGASVEAIRTAENRHEFKAAMEEIGLARAALGLRVHARRGDGDRRAGRLPADRAAVVHPRRRRHRLRRRRRRAARASPRTASPPARCRRSSSSSRSRGGRSTSSR